MKLKGKKIVILIEKMYQEVEGWYSYYRLKEEGAEVLFAAPQKGMMYEGKSGYPATSKEAIANLRANDYDAVIVPGGFAPDYLRRVPETVEFIKEMHNEGKIIATICHGAWLLASAEIIEGKSVTSYFAIKDDIVHAGANFIDEEVVQDGNIITSRKPDDTPAFCLKIIEALS